ncbi:MAG: flagellar basal-body MS-ring/collar protein FliF [Bacillota bacterium]
MGDLFNRIKNGFLETWSNLDKSSKIRIGIISGLFIALFIAFVVYSSAPQWEPLYNSTDPVSAGKIYQQIKDMGIKVKAEGSTIYVEKGRAADLQMQLYAEGILTEEGTIPQTQQTNSFLMTSEDKRQMYLRDKQNEIRRGLRSLQGVADATVLIQIPEQDSFVLSGSEKEGSASLIVRMKPGAEALTANKVKGIVSLVAKSVGIKPENVEILDEAGNPLTQTKEDLNAGTSSAFELQQKYRLEIEQQLMKILAKSFGKDNVVALAAVNINTSSTLTNERIVQPVDEEEIKGIVSNIQQIRKSWVDAGSGGAAGTDTNTEINQYLETEEGKAEYNETNEIINYEFSEISRQIESEIGNIEDLSLAIQINQSILKEETDLAALQEQVTNLVVNATKAFVPEKTSEDHAKNITISITPFDDSAAVAYREQLEREQAQEAMQNYIRIGSVAAFILVLGISMFLFIRRKSVAVREQELEEELAIAAAAGPVIPLEEIDLEDRNEIKKKIEKFVGQKPDQVAVLLKSWLNEE